MDRNRPARYEVGGRAALKVTGQPVEILEVRRGEFVPDFVYKVRVLAERPARPYNLSVPEHDLKDSYSAGQQGAGLLPSGACESSNRVGGCESCGKS